MAEISSSAPDWARRYADDVSQEMAEMRATFRKPLRLPPYVVANLPAVGPSIYSLIFVTNESGGAVPAFSDGTNWRRVTDRAIVS
jgi:hypothetical protein